MHFKQNLDSWLRGNDGDCVQNNGWHPYPSVQPSITGIGGLVRDCLGTMRPLVLGEEGSTLQYREAQGTERSSANGGVRLGLLRVLPRQHP